MFHSWNNFSGMWFGCSVNLVGNSGGVTLGDENWKDFSCEFPSPMQGFWSAWNAWSTGLLMYLEITELLQAFK